ncbi:MAG: MBOAT family O-acyltransferase [Pseudomonadota bacterium]
MVFSSTIFLFLFLPLVLLAYLVLGRKLRNIVLLIASLAFYAWGENIFVLLMLVSILLNYSFGILIDYSQRHGGNGKIPLIFAVTANLGLLGFFKYANFIVANLNTILLKLQMTPLVLEKVHLPIGISFFTFQSLSYVIDLYRRETFVQKNLINIALYVSLFPQLIAGPIIRYHDIASQIVQRRTRFDDFSYGIQRFIIGLGKKVLLANVLGRTADYIFSLPPGNIPASLAWLGAVSYTLQIYYDFSGYSDMAIGLGRMFGFHFMENFNYPYLSKSIREFWCRWHISLSSWFRDYLYIPLGGNRYGNARTYFNLLIVFLLCGLWHGACWTFVIWGLYHGGFLILERLSPGKYFLNITPAPVKHLYVLLVVIIGWVFFRAETFAYALGYLRAMVTFSTPDMYNSQLFLSINNEFYVVLLIAVICSAPIFNMLGKPLESWGGQLSMSGMLFRFTRSLSTVCFFCFVFLYSIASLMGGSYNPFLYFRF